MPKNVLILAFLALLIPALAQAQSVYRWTDENGVTHYGDREPTGRAADKVNIRTGQSSGQPAQQSSPQEQVRALDEQQAEHTRRANETAAEEARRKQREANCATARSNLQVLRTNARIRIEEDGEQRYLTPEEIDTQTTRFEEIAAENCVEEGG